MDPTPTPTPTVTVTETATPAPADVHVTALSPDLTYSFAVVVFLLSALLVVWFAHIVRGQS